jgi:gliding motility-associated-like protein
MYGLNESITGLPLGTNQFTVLSSEGCPLETLSVNVAQDKCDSIIFPNTFTPNGDNINDIFRPNQDANPSGYKLSIYDRRGSLVFQSQTIFNGWDGKYNGKPAPAGVYYYVAHATTPNGASEIYSGSVTLIR